MKTIEIKSIEGTKKSVEIIIDKVSYTLPALFKAKSQKGNVISIEFKDSLIRTILIDNLSKLTVNDLSFSITSDAVVAINELSNFNMPGGSGGNNPAVWGSISGDINAQTDLSERLKTIQGIAEGAQMALVFDDRAQLDEWVEGTYEREDGISIADAKAGWKFLLRSSDEPDQWWDGETLHPLEAKTDLSNYYDKDEISTLLAKKQRKVIQLTCPTGITTAAKVITDESYTLEAGDLISVKFTSGNTASSPTLNINGTGAKPVLLGGTAPTGASGTGAAYCAANGRTHYFYDGENFYQLGSNDITDADTAFAMDNIYGAVINGARISPATVTPSGTKYHSFIGFLEDGTVDKVTATANVTTATARTFTPNKISLFKNIFYLAATSGAWTANAVISEALFSRHHISSTNWKYAIGQYYDKSGVLQGNDITTDLVVTNLYIGGTQYGEFFIPVEYSLTFRDTNLVYKRLGQFGAAGNFYFSDYQYVFKYVDGKWRQIGVDSDRIVTLHNELSGRNENNCHPIESITNLTDELDKKIEDVPESCLSQIQNAPEDLRGMAVSSDGRIYFSTSTATYRLNQDNTFTKIMDYAIDLIDYTRSAADNNGGIYFVSGTNLYYLDSNENVSTIAALGSNGRSVGFHKNGNLYIACSDYSVKYLDIIGDGQLHDTGSTQSGTFTKSVIADNGKLYFVSISTGKMFFIDDVGLVQAVTSTVSGINIIGTRYDGKTAFLDDSYARVRVISDNNPAQVVLWVNNTNLSLTLAVTGYKGKTYLCGNSGIYTSDTAGTLTATNITQIIYRAFIGKDERLYFLGDTNIFVLDNNTGLIEPVHDIEEGGSYTYAIDINGVAYIIKANKLFAMHIKAGSYLREHGEWIALEDVKIPISNITKLQETLLDIQTDIENIQSDVEEIQSKVYLPQPDFSVPEQLLVNITSILPQNGAGTTVTIPADGFLIFDVYATTFPQSVNFQVNGNKVWTAYQNTAATLMSHPIPVKAGDVLRVTNSGTANMAVSRCQAKFYPLTLFTFNL